MNYIILDLEWDGAFYPKIGRFINQILQIGAVKLNEKFEIIDTFEQTVRSSFSNRVSKRFAELTGITKEKMLSGVSLDTAFTEYNNWVGNDTVTMTWSNSDIYTLIDNQNNITDQKLKIEKYLDLQKYVQDEMRSRGIEVSSQISLLNAANQLNISIDESVLHNAKYDSIACAALFKECYNSERFNSMVINASDPDFLSRYTFKPHFITDINDPAIDRSVFDFKCETCGSPLKLKGEWRARNCAFYADMLCTECRIKYFTRVRIRKLYDSVKVHRKLYIKRKKEQKNDM
ncbi:MAG: exonuclease domain-containing protein [Clostridia bacterium]|nr:exonuclease domain-containing protein [Clostridia bacterium]